MTSAIARTNLRTPSARRPVYLYHGADDAIVTPAHVLLYKKAIPHAVVRTFERRDHQLNNDMSDVAQDIRSVG